MKKKTNIEINYQKTCKNIVVDISHECGLSKKQKKHVDIAKY